MRVKNGCAETRQCNANKTYIKPELVQQLVKMTATMRYFKVTNEAECHIGFHCKTGLNALPFQPEGSCVSGGLSFTDSANVLEYVFWLEDGYGVWIREVFLPTEDPDFCMVKDPGSGIWRANKIILGDRYSLSDPATYEAIDLDMLGIDSASCHGYVDILRWWKRSGRALAYSDNAIDYASFHGHVHVLDWWKNSGLELKYTADAIALASLNGRIAVLDWWKSSDLDLKYTHAAIDQASEFGQVKVLEWWKNSDLELLYTNAAINLASECGYVEVLEWWKNSGLELRYTKDAIDEASLCGKVRVLEWWKNSDLEMRYTKKGLKWDPKSNNYVLSWWQKSGLPVMEAADAKVISQAC